MFLLVLLFYCNLFQPAPMEGVQPPPVHRVMYTILMQSLQYLNVTVSTFLIGNAVHGFRDAENDKETVSYDGI
jgi:hypothetical protein